MEFWQELENRIKKNVKKLKSFAKKNVVAYRVYDRDIPDFPYIIDKYQDEAVVYIRAKKNFYEKYPERADEKALQSLVSKALCLAEENVHLKVRDKQRGKSQYQRLKKEKEYSIVAEGDCSFLVNTKDLLDTGLFLDHRPLRFYVRSSDGQGKSFLNLFSYTSSVSVAAALAGYTTTSVDMSNTYVKWSEANFQINGINIEKHKIVREDVFKYLDQQGEQSFDVIYLDPPTFSNSKKMDQILDIQRDQNKLVTAAMKMLKHDGLLIFSNNKKGFKLSDHIKQSYEVTDKTKWSIPVDYRDQSIHVCYFIRKRNS